MRLNIPKDEKDSLSGNVSVHAIPGPAQTNNWPGKDPAAVRENLFALLQFFGSQAIVPIFYTSCCSISFCSHLISVQSRTSSCLKKQKRRGHGTMTTLAGTVSSEVAARLSSGDIRLCRRRAIVCGRKRFLRHGSLTTRHALEQGYDLLRTVSGIYASQVFCYKAA